ncbi:MAG: beta-mannosidase [Armatimonadota bacterium]
MYIQGLESHGPSTYWQLRRADGDQWYDADVPGCVHTDLMKAGVIPDPFEIDNEVRVAWVAETDWVYSRTFDAREMLLEQDHIFLNCCGLDTIATIRLNGSEIAKTDNMFRPYSFDVSGIIKPKDNIIEIEFMSPVNYAKPKLGTDNAVSPGDSIPGSPYLRKAMYQWGWDWAPKIPTSGIWKNIVLAGYGAARFDDIRINQTHKDGKVAVNVSASIERFCECELTAIMNLTHPDGTVQKQPIHASKDSTHVQFEINVDNPQLWWPNRYGDQPLYDVSFELIHTGQPKKDIDYRMMQIGLRTIELVQNPDEWGKSWYFKANGLPILCKGADWVPADQFPSRIDPMQYHDLIRDAANANMNMLRVWGGGLYESGEFYSFCDKYGILVWQDFPFACAHYPVDDAIMANIRLEAADNIRRIRHHASLALWCGNNEIEWFLAGDWGGEKNPVYRKEYMKIYYELLPEVHAAEDPATPYWPASPASSVPFEDPNGENEGDGHYWDVWHGRLPFTAYRKHYYRFMSEFGFESMPALDTIKAFARPQDMNMTSLVMENHQKNSAGNGLILFYMAQTFQFPKDFSSMVYVSQLLQAEAMRYGVEHWRRNRNGFRCMGTLYWQYNDCWPVASWASVDYYNRWKALQYFAKRFYAPVLLSAEEDPTSVRLHVTNDQQTSFEGLVRWSLETMHGSILKSGDVPVYVSGGSDVKVADLDFSDLLDYDTRRQTVLVYELHSAGKRISMGMASFAPSKHLDLLPADISVDVKDIEGGFQISIESDAAARYVMLEIPGCDLVFSDNYFDLPAGRTVEITGKTKAGMSAEQVAGQLKISSLRDTY